jgi:hypothetical protein
VTTLRGKTAQFALQTLDVGHAAHSRRLGRPGGRRLRVFTHRRLHGQVILDMLRAARAPPRKDRLRAGMAAPHCSESSRIPPWHGGALPRRASGCTPSAEFCVLQPSTGRMALRSSAKCAVRTMVATYHTALHPSSHTVYALGMLVPPRPPGCALCHCVQPVVFPTSR